MLRLSEFALIVLDSDKIDLRNTWLAAGLTRGRLGSRQAWLAAEKSTHENTLALIVVPSGC